MTEKFKILAEFIKDMSSETPDTQTYLFVKDNISKYHLNIDINSKALKNKLIEINTILKFQDKDPNDKKSHFEIVYASVVKIDDEIKEKKDLEKIILCDVQNKIYPKLEKAFLNLLNDSGFPGIKLEKKIDFNKLYNEKSNYKKFFFKLFFK
jgi:preprotein translocase subunit SecB